MTRFGITGGIGSGKSFVCRLLEEAGCPVFYCDDEAKRIIATHPLVHQELTALVGPDVYAPDGKLQKKILSAWICSGEDKAQQVNSIVHPRVAEAFQHWCRQQVTERVYMECALLWESGFDRLVDKTVLVDAPDEVRLKRVMKRDNISEEKARSWMNLQMPEEEKRKRADFIIQNKDGQTPDISIIL